MTATVCGIAMTIGETLLAIIRDYQTLIAGLVAIGAAFITARPVWRQLERMSIQTNTILRDFLMDRIRIINRQRKWITDHLETFDQEVSRRIYEMEEMEGGSINIHWAFDQDQAAGTLLDSLQRYRDERFHSPAIEVDLNVVVSDLQKLREIFNAIHRTHSMDQSGEDYSISDEEWAEMGEVGRSAEKNLPSVANAFSISVKQILKTISGELNSLRERVSESDQALLKARR